MAKSRNGRYLEEKEIGSGAFGTVYLVNDTKDNSKLAFVFREENSPIKN